MPDGMIEVSVGVFVAILVLPLLFDLVEWMQDGIQQGVHRLLRFPQNRRLQLFYQRQTEIQAHRIRNEPDYANSLLARWEALEPQDYYFFSQSAPHLWRAMLEVRERHRASEQIQEELQPPDDILMHEGESGCHA